MDFPSDILDIRDIKSFYSLEIRVSNEITIELKIDTTVSKTNLNLLKTALMHHKVNPSTLCTIVDNYEIKGKREDLGEYTFGLKKSSTVEELNLNIYTPRGNEENIKLLFKVIKTYMELTKPDDLELTKPNDFSN